MATVTSRHSHPSSPAAAVPEDKLNRLDPKNDEDWQFVTEAYGFEAEEKGGQGAGAPFFFRGGVE